MPDGDDDPITAIVAMLVLGAGLVALFAGVNWFWMVWVLGFAVFVPVVAILTDQYDLIGVLTGRGRSGSLSRPASDGDRKDDALETLKRRYARGEIDDEEFERRLERLVENESIDEVEARFERERERERDPEVEFER
jgi:uncharacterized membrane protein